MSFGPSPTHWMNESGGGGETTKLEVLATVGQAGLTDLDLMGAGENTPDSIPLETPGGERIGSVRNIHFSSNERDLIGTVITSKVYRVEELTTEFTTNRRKVVKVVLVK